ncbi:Maltose O-acetyltransferase [Streptomyces sp. PVA_94-07]|nr:Maltose O-acetyltransferase [Streptomyces sp. PVA_94-07]
MASQKERMLAGELYQADDPEIQADAARSAKLSERFNASPSDDPLGPPDPPRRTARQRRRGRGRAAAAAGGLRHLHHHRARHLRQLRRGLPRRRAHHHRRGRPVRPARPAADPDPPGRPGRAAGQVGGGGADHHRRQRVARRRRHRLPRGDDRGEHRGRRGSCRHQGPAGQRGGGGQPRPDRPRDPPARGAARSLTGPVPARGPGPYRPGPLA